MKTHKPTLWMTALFSSMALVACVTINIYFPAEKVESAAEQIVDEIRGETSTEDQSFLRDLPLSLTRTIAVFVSPRAWAQEALNISNPTIRSLKQRMKARYARMKPYYENGMLTEKNDGYVAIDNTSGLGLKERRDLKALVSAENSDRQRLYQEIAKAMKIDPGRIDRIARIFAKEWQKPVR